MAPSLGLILWHGGFRSPAQLGFAALALAGLILFPARILDPTMLSTGLLLMAAADAASLVWHRDSGSIAPALAVCAVPAVVAIAVPARARLRSELPIAVALLGATVATTGLTALVLRTEPLAERIGGIWRAAGTFEYPPALGLMCVCAIAAVIALHADGRLDGRTATVLAALLLAGTAATYDRVAWIEASLTLALFGWRVPPARRVAGLAALGACVALLAVVVMARPHALMQHLRHGPITSRSDVWSDAWRGIRSRPLIGYGPGRFLDIYNNRNDLTQTGLAHNAPLEQAVESGVIGGVGAAVALAAMVLLGATGLASRDPLRVSHGVAATAIALSGLYDFTWSFPPLLLVGVLSALAARAP